MVKGMFEYYDNDFARGRLENTIISVGGRAALIHGVQGDQDLVYTDLEGYKEGVVNIRDEKVDIIPPRLGYVSFGGDWMFFERVPERRWKQGIPYSLFGNRAEGRRETVSLGKSLNGGYVKFNVAKRSKQITAFSLHFAIANGALFFKGKPVGTVSLEGVVQLAERFIFLKEYLEESLK